MWHGVLWCVMVSVYGMMRSDMSQYNMMSCCVIWYGVPGVLWWYYVVWYGEVRCDVIWCDVVLCDVI